jgi:hypothetical protein
VTALAVHLFRYDPSAVAVPAEPRPVRDKITLGDWPCVMCGVLASFAQRYDLDHAGDCPGAVRAAATRNAGPRPVLSSLPVERPPAVQGTLFELGEVA